MLYKVIYLFAGVFVCLIFLLQHLLAMHLVNLDMLTYSHTTPIRNSIA